MERIEQIKKLLKSDENDSFLQHALALEYIKMGDDAAAKVLFNSILEREPGYIGSYYHLGKLLERNNDFPAAIGVYKKGMEVAESAKDHHSFTELQAAFDELEVE
ncbi:MAG: hypothetical protein ABIO76_05445 [Ginsengibacter sp.]